MIALLLAALEVHALPPVDVAARDVVGVAYSAGDAGAPPADPWWSTLGDPALAGVLDTALAGNHSVRASWERVGVARTVAGQTASALLPTASLTASWSRLSTDATVLQYLNQQSGQYPGLTDDELREQIEESLGTSYDAASWALGGAWAIDLFGVTTTAWMAGRWDARAMEGSLAAQSMVVAAAVGGAWYDLVAARKRLAFVQEQVRISEELLALIEMRYAGSAATALDVLQQRQQVASAAATLPAVQAAVDRTAWGLAALLGRDPSATTPETFPVPDDLIDPPAAPALGRPADLLTRRPDLVAAVASAEAADLRRLSAWLGMAPQLALSASTGEQGQILGADADEWDRAAAWSYGVQATVPLLNGGRKLAAARGAAAGARAAVHDLQQATLDAVADVEGSRRVLQQRREEVAARTAQVTAAQQSYSESRARYLGGLTPYVNLMTTLNTLQGAELGLISARRDLLGAHIDLHNALGASWALDSGATGGP